MSNILDTLIGVIKTASFSTFSSTSPLKILSFLAENPEKEFLGSEIQKATSISRAGVYIALKVLISQKLVLKTQKGKFNLYAVAYEDPVVRQFKVLRNIILLKPAVSRLKAIAKKIILFGSASRGEDSSVSDLDVFVISRDHRLAKKILSSIKIERNIQPVVISPSDWITFKEKEKVFSDEVNRGITLWEEKE